MTKVHICLEPEAVQTLSGSIRTHITERNHAQEGTLLLDHIPLYTSSSDYLLISSSSSSLICDSPAQFSSDESKAIVPFTASTGALKPVVPAVGLPERAAVKPVFSNLTELNFCDADELDQYAELMEPAQKALWRIRNQKAEKDFSKYYTSKYLELLCPLIASNFKNADSITHCMNTFVGRASPCTRWTLCDRCANYEGMQKWRMYKSAFDEGFEFFSVTLGFDGGLPFSTNNAIQCKNYWNTNKQVVRSMLTSNLIDGAYLVHELKILSFLPLTVNAHSHVVMASTNELNTLETEIQQMITHGGLPLNSSVRIKEIPSISDFERVVKYLTKAIDIKPAYNSAWNTYCAGDRSKAPELNRQVREFYEAQALATQGTIKMSAFGNLDTRSSSFIGTKPPQKKVKKKKRFFQETPPEPVPKSKKQLLPQSL